MQVRKWYTWGLVLLFIGYVLAQWNKPQPLDWSETLQYKHTIPFGTFVLHQQLPQLVKKGEVITKEIPVYNVLHNQKHQQTAYIFIANKLTWNDLDVKEALQFVQQGNTLFLSAYLFSKNITDSLGFKIKQQLVLPTDSLGFQLHQSNTKIKAVYVSPHTSANAIDSVLNYRLTQVLGSNTKGLPNFIQIKMGKGFCYVHTNPQVFTNYFLLNKKEANAYTTQVIKTVLQIANQQIFWDAYYQTGKNSTGSPLKFMLENKALQWAWYLIVVGVLLFALFKMKRIQRIIPIIEPLKNNTLEFVQTIAGLAYQKKQHYAMAEKKWQHWQEFIRSKFHIYETYTHPQFVNKLAAKTGMEENEIKKIINVYTSLSPTQVTDNELLAFTHLIDEFYLKST
ncbi:MAG: DUF4350 domain-containing protein [Chitinophagaceae bacterium]